MKKNDVFLFVISHLVPEIFKIFVSCKLGMDDVIRCDNTPSSRLLLCYYAGMVIPVFDLEHCPLPKLILILY